MSTSLKVLFFDTKSYPCGRAGEPTVFGLSVEFGVAARYHLGINVWFRMANFADVLQKSRQCAKGRGFHDGKR